MIVNADMRHMRQHPLDRSRPPEFDQAAIAESVAGENQAAVLEALRPLGPAASRILPVDRKDRHAELGVPSTVESRRFYRRDREDSLRCR